MEIPETVTERLVLREFRDSDFEAYAAMVADPAETVEFCGAPAGIYPYKNP
jgi:RimJ/RimL family protein N-acetyltransferase